MRRAKLISPSPIIRAVMERARQQGMTQAEVCRQLGITPRSLSYLLSGERSPGRQVLKGIVRVYPDLAPLVVLEYL